MDFGKVQNVAAVDFKFPPDHPHTSQLLALNQSKKKPNIYVGCAKWGRPDWIGKLYPKGTRSTDFLKHYVKHFNSIELNAMFYQTSARTLTEKWASYAAKDFQFAPKLSKEITHIKRLKGVESETNEFLESLVGFGDKLGHSFMQFDEHFGIQNFDLLRRYLEYLPRDFKVCVEFRHQDWFKDSTVGEETYQLLKALKVGFVITDTSGRRDVLHTRLTTPVAFIRFVGNNLHPTDFKRIDDWVERIAKWIEDGIETIYFFIHNHEELNSPELCKYTIQKLNTAANLNLALPKLINSNLDLF